MKPEPQVSAEQLSKEISEKVAEIQQHLKEKITKPSRSEIFTAVAGICLLICLGYWVGKRRAIKRSREQS